MEWKIAAGLLGICLIVLSVLLFFRHRRRERELEQLIDYLMKQQDGAALPKPEKFGEGRLGILQSELYKLIVQMNSQRDLAKSEKNYLSDLLSDISHQIKTPLAAIAIMTDLLKNPQLSEEKRQEFLSNIDRETERITWLVKNLLVLSQLEAGVLKLKREQITAPELLEGAMKPFEAMAEVKGVSLELKALSEIQLVCDIRWTTEAISNILKNCLEHTDSGGFVRAEVSRNNFSVNIRILDNGSGISEQDLPHIFERFYKASTAGAASVGIGLAMSRQIFLLQGATVSAVSREGEGTEFLIKFYHVR